MLCIVYFVEFVGMFLFNSPYGSECKALTNIIIIIIIHDNFCYYITAKKKVDKIRLRVCMRGGSGGTICFWWGAFRGQNVFLKSCTKLIFSFWVGRAPNFEAYAPMRVAFPYHSYQMHTWSQYSLTCCHQLVEISGINRQHHCMF